MTHSFGNEVVVSTEQCFQFFCNNLSLGQWELASSCVAQLIQREENTVSCVKDILKTVIECPYEFSYGSPSLPSPNHLSWLCFQEYERFTTIKDTIPRTLHKDVEFRLLLFCLCHEDTAPEALKGLYNYHNHVLAYEDAGVKFVGIIPSLTESSLAIVSRTLKRDPVLAHTIIAYLTVKNDSEHLKNNQSLQQLYLDCINIDAQELQEKSDWENIERCELTAIVSHLCQMLMFFDPTSDMVGLRIRDAFWEILTLIETQPFIEEDTIYSTLVGRSNVFLIQQFIMVQNEFRLKKQKADQVPCSEEDVKISAELSQSEDREKAWKDMFHKCFTLESHMLENVLETALELIKEGMFEQLKCMLEPAELEPLKPLVLLLGWNYCFSCTTATQLLDALWITQEIQTQPSLEQACNKLSYQVQLVQWCLQKAQPLSWTSEMSNTLHQRASHMFHGLESHSVLYVLHQSLRLADLDQKLVLDILNERPVLPATNDGKGTETKKSVRFAPTEDETKQRVSIEQERDTVIYRSYSCIKLIIDIIHLCKQSIVTDSDKTELSQDPFGAATEGAPEIDDKSNSGDLSAESGRSYEDLVTKKLEAARQHLSQIFPLSYRVETLENIFSLLFVKHGDIKESSPIHSESGSEREEDHSDVYPRQVRSNGDMGVCPMTPVLERSLELTADALETVAMPEITETNQITPQITKDETLTVTNETPRLTSDELLKKATGLLPTTTAADSGTDKMKSDNASGRSSVSLELRTGHIINRQMTGDILQMLKDCLIEIGTAKYALKGGQSPAESNLKEASTDPHVDLTNEIRSSVSPNNFQQRLAKLNQYINEALWRYQLVAQPSNDHHDEKKLMDDVYDSYTDDDDLSCYGDSDGEDRLSQRKRRLRSDLKSRSSSVWDSSGVESGSHTTSSQRSVELLPSDTSGNSLSRRRRKKRKQRKRSSRRSLQKSNTGIIPRMLATPDTLLRMCLRKSNYTQAAQVTKLLKIEDDSEVGEVSFAQHLDVAVKKIENLEPKKPSSASKALNRTPSALSNLSAIANVAASGMASLSITGIVDELLSTSELPVVVSRGDGKNCDALLEAFVADREVPSLVIMDLAATVSKSWDVCKDLLQMTTDKLPTSTERVTVGASSKHATSPLNFGGRDGKVLKGPLAVMQQLCALIAQCSHEASASLRPPLLQKFYQRSIPDVLTTGTYPVHADSLKGHVESTLEQDRVVQKLEGILKDYCVQDDDSDDGGSAEKEKVKKTAVITAGQSVNRTLVRQTMKQLIQIYGKNKAMAFVRITRDKSTGRNDNPKADYLTSLYHHIDILASLLLDSTDVIAGSSGVKAANPFIVLNEGLTSTFGKMMFEQHIPPNRLENVASQLKLNLVHIVVQICSPSIPMVQLTRPSTPEDVELDPCGRLVLNSKGNVNDRRHPEVIAGELLTRMLSLMKVHAKHTGIDDTFDMTSAIHAVKTEEYKDIVNASQALASVDLTQLQNRNEKICFYANVLNLLIIHASLYHIQKYTKNREDKFIPQHSRHSSISKLINLEESEDLGLPYSPSSTTLDRLIYLSKISYQIGQLGTVSALDLRYVFLRNGLPPPSSFENILQSRIHAPGESDVWNSFIPPLDVKLLFAIHMGFISSPNIKVLRPRELQSQLLQSMSAYMDGNISVDIDKQQVTMPELLHWYCKDFVAISDPDLFNEGILNFITTFTTSELKTRLEMLKFSSTARQIDYEISPKMPRRSLFTALQQEEPKKPATFQIKVEPHRYKYGYIFDDFGEDAYRSIKTRRRHSSLPRNISTEKSKQQQGLIPLYRMTPATVTYLKRKSDFVAALVFLLSPRSEIKEKKSEDDGDQATSDGERKKETTLERMLLTVEKYAVLQRYIRTNMTTLMTVSCEVKEESGYQAFSELRKKDVGRCILSGMDSSELHSLVLKALNQLVCAKRWKDAVQLIQSVCHQGDGFPDQCVATDFILCCAGTSATSQQSAGSWKYLLQLTDRNLFAHTVLTCLQCWSVEVCVHLLEQGLAYPPTNKPLGDALQKKLAEMKVYQKVIECSNKLDYDTSLDFSQTLKDDPDVPITTKWQLVEMEFRNNPDRVIKLLIDCQEFDVARQWTQTHRVPESLKETIDVKYLQHKLSDNTNIMKAYQMLEAIYDEKRCHRICELVLPNLKGHLESSVFLSQYLLTRLKSQLTENQPEELQSINLGAKALLCLPESAQQNYRDLISKPHLIVEQLLMNMKVDLAEKVLETMKKEIRNAQFLPVEKCSEDVLDELVLVYATKALEFPIVQEREETSDLESTLLQSMASTPQSGTQSTMEQSILSQSQFISSVAITTTPMTASKALSSSTVSVPGIVMTSSTTMPEATQKASDRGWRTPPLASMRPLHSLEGRYSPSGSLSKRSSGNTSPIGSFGKRSSEMMGHRHCEAKGLPLVPPNQKDWVPDSAATHCMVCKVERFSMFNRRHHCRRCGRVVCASCSERTSIVRGYGDVPVRICDDCFDHFVTKTTNQGVAPEILEQKLKEKLAGGLQASPSPKVLTPNLSSHGSGTTPIAATEIPELMEPQDWYAEEKPQQQWRLTTDDIYNDTIRDDFYYEQAPSTSLCMSILDLHSQPLKCAKQILEMCQDVSEYLKPIKPGIPNPEVDYNLVISMIQTLLLNAKVRYMKCSQSSGVALCDTYLSRVDILTMMLSANYKNIPTIEELIKADSARRIRDKLLQDERLALAMEVSTKCGLDSTAVWLAWGTAHLKAAEYQQAREKFSRVLKTPADRNQLQKPSPLLSDIINFLEEAPRSDVPLAESFLTPLRSMRELISDPAKGLIIHCQLDAAQFEECLYYMKSYGTHLAIVEFYKKHNFLPKAVQYIVEQQCSTEVFIEGLLLPSIKGGDLAALQEQMLVYDPSLEKWNTYLNASCRYLNKKSYTHVLYQFQLFMKDYIRAAMTCIKFFQSGASTYAELFDHLNHLNNARTHMKEVLDEKKWGMVPRPAMISGRKSPGDWSGSLMKSEQTGMRLVLSPSELSKHINTITLQIEVTKYLHRCLTSKSGINDLLSPKKELPTLFGNNKSKAEVVSMVLLNSGSISEGFQLAFKIIQDFRLPATLVYCHTSKQLAHKRKYKEIRQLLQCIRESGLADDQTSDDVVSACINVIVGESSESKEVDHFIKLLKSDTSKINASILSGKLKSAYLIAVQGEREDDVRRISSAAQKSGQMAVKSICDRWLQAQEKKRQRELEQQQLLLKATKQKP